MARTGNVRLIDQRTAEERDRSFLPAMRRTWLLPLYDGLSRFAGTAALHQRVVGLADIAADQEVLDVGCGTGNLTLAVLAAQPSARVTGLDPDAAALHRAARKARRRGVSLTLVCGYADRLPAEDGSLDRVVSALALHHVDEESRVAFAREAFRVLRPGGTVTVSDFGGHGQNQGSRAGPGGHAGHKAAGDHHGPAHALRHVASMFSARLARQPRLAHSLGDGVPALFTEAGFTDAREVDHVTHRYGPISFVQATRS